MRRRVVVTGIGAVSPLGLGAPALYSGWAARQSGIEDGLGRCSDFDPLDFLTKKDLRRCDRFTQLAIAAAQEAIGQATRDGRNPFDDPDRVACIVGAGGGGMSTMENARPAKGAAEPGEGEERRVSPYTVPKMMCNAPAGMISIRHGLRGPAFAVVSACAAGADAIATAVRLVRCGEVDAAVTGGTESSMTKFTIENFAAMQATSREGISRPFDRRRDGFILAEGAGILVVENLETARQRDADIVGEILGIGASSDAYNVVTPDPTGGGAALAMRRALDDAGIDPQDIDYVNAHGTSTPLNDRSETVALKLVLGEHAKHVPVSSTKSAIGHLLSAAGAIEAIATLQALGERTAPPTLNYEEPDDGLDLDYVADGPRPLRSVNGNGTPRAAVAMSNSFGFGGHNSVLCLAGDGPE
jgi:3-oxoacyl-[acyl-carrier-protein] synthase II